jgi:Pilus formation protein N terminal region
MMALFVGPCGPFGGPVRRPSLLVFALALGLATVAAPTTAPAADIQVILNQARIVNLPDKVTTVVIGNPIIADATLQPGGLTVITGKSYGSTNFIALDRSGAVLTEMMINVGISTADSVVVYRGMNRETYSCVPICQPRIMLGDAQPYFGAQAAQSTTHNGLAQAASRPK